MGIKIYKNAVSHTIGFNQGSEEKEGCIVKFDGDNIRVEYPVGEVYVYEGKDVGNGHYNLHNAKGDKSTLHITPGYQVLEGYWEEDGCNGMWRILLKE